MNPIRAIMIGAGGRGMEIYGGFAEAYPDELSFIAVAEPDSERRKKFSEAFNIPKNMQFKDYRSLLKQNKIADVAFICTQDSMHFEPSVMALNKGYHILLEKPMSTKLSECVAIDMAAKNNNRIVSVSHVLRYAPFFMRIKAMLDSGVIGRLISIQHNENVGHWHQAHSYVRGLWRSEKESSPMILAKCCHDMDILYYLANAKCKKLSSFGSLTYFKPENAPDGAPKRCTDGCPAELSCPYNAVDIYMKDIVQWPITAISNDHSHEARLKALRKGHYGRCVFHCDNDVVDHQVVNMEFENEVTVAFTMCAFTNKISRSIKLMGTAGEIRGVMEMGELEVTNFKTGKSVIYEISTNESGHGGGDYALTRDFLNAIKTGAGIITSSEDSLHSHAMAFAAEKSRVWGKVVDLDEFVAM